jgi:excisionase family DNA binding protein
MTRANPMASVADAGRRAPRYGSAAELAAYAGLSVKTIRRLVDAGKIRCRKVGRRLLIPFEDLDAHILETDEDRRPIMAANSTTLATPEADATPFVPPTSPEELALRNRAAMALLDEWAVDVEDEREQRETMDVLRRALGPGRIASDRPAIP